MDIKKIYISGKITGLPIDEVVAKFKAAEAKIKRFGFQPVNPLRNGLPREAEWAAPIGEDVKPPLTRDASYLMADWQQSEGATLEYLIARQRRMRIFFAETFAAHAAVETNTEQSHETEA